MIFKSTGTTKNNFQLDTLTSKTVETVRIIVQ